MTIVWLFVSGFQEKIQFKQRLISRCIYPGLKEAHDSSSRWQLGRLYRTDSIPRHVPLTTGTSSSTSKVTLALARTNTSTTFGISKCHPSCWCDYQPANRMGILLNSAEQFCHQLLIIWYYCFNCYHTITWFPCPQLLANRANILWQISVHTSVSVCLVVSGHHLLLISGNYQWRSMFYFSFRIQFICLPQLFSIPILLCNTVQFFVV